VQDDAHLESVIATVGPTPRFLAWCDASAIPDGDRDALWRLHRQWRRTGLDEAERLAELRADHDHWRLYRATVEGDALGAATFEKHWRGYVRAFCSGRFSHDETDELFSRLLSRMVERLDRQFAWQCPFTTYVRAILVNLSRDLVRERARRRDREVGMEGTASDSTTSIPGAEQRLLDAETRAAVHRALGALAPGDRQILVLHVVGGEPAPTVAAELGITVNALYQRLHRARARLREVLAKEGLVGRGQRP
jgi:RNA polymerase sigma factor (sigma-70 family)